jgi:exoribonuclease II
MTDDRDDRVLPSPAERHIARSRIDDRPAGPLSEHQLYTQRSVESYLRGAVMPRYMSRLRDITRMIERHERELEEAYATLAAEHAGDPGAFAAAWRRRVAAWSFDEVNDLIEQHNEWYPVERQLPFDLSTRDYVLIAGRSYRREPLTAEWALARYPAER